MAIAIPMERSVNFSYMDSITPRATNRTNEYKIK